ncbi:F-box/LRR-repeat protein At4g14103-like isoform X2 [Papaver somniferum]|uniref:F-box/LRR-repeat protein At4g14103-like isoform X2 n=1 Tax=Papaver somniferum TaxID=3469 RepID=UPI000E6F56F1|nr:F-box/LRR-repeat protein At4g14103-like isoform X2 [Papaver somniferum]
MLDAPDDKISNLPDSLIHNILAFLHITDCARASVLSRRWNYIWTAIPSLCLGKRDPRSLHYPSPDETEKFMDFLDETLHRSNSSNVDVDKFSLVWPLHLNETRLHSWITNLIRGKVKMLKLYLRQEPLSYIPLSLFTCESLTSLELGVWLHHFTFPKYISFPRLKHLRLWEFRFSDEFWNEELFSNFLVLEELSLPKCEFRLRNFCISIPTLKLLKISVWELRDGSLESDNVAKENVLSSFPALVEADVRCYDKKDIAGINQLLRAIAHVKCLTVSDLTLKLNTAIEEDSDIDNEEDSDTNNEEKSDEEDRDEDDNDDDGGEGEDSDEEVCFKEFFGDPKGAEVGETNFEDRQSFANDHYWLQRERRKRIYGGDTKFSKSLARLCD